MLNLNRCKGGLLKQSFVGRLHPVASLRSCADKMHLRGEKPQAHWTDVEVGAGRKNNSAFSGD
jgi:hypothetical protein